MIGFFAFIIYEVNVESGNNFNRDGCINLIAPPFMLLLFLFIFGLVGSFFEDIFKKSSKNNRQDIKENKQVSYAKYIEAVLDIDVFTHLGYFVRYENRGMSNQKLVYLRKNGINVTSFDIPATYNYNGKNYKITKIGDRAFQNCSSLISVNIPNTVEYIGIDAFAECENLTSVTISDGVIRIGGWAFRDCKSLKNIVVPDSVTNIDNCAFMGIPHIEYHGKAEISWLCFIFDKYWGAKSIN